VAATAPTPRPSSWHIHNGVHRGPDRAGDLDVRAVGIEDMVQQAWHFRDERRVSIDQPLLDPATWPEKPGGEDTHSDGAATTPGSDSPRVTARFLEADRLRGTIRPEALEEFSWPPREDHP
jgi:hypothetical protein